RAARRTPRTCSVFRWCSTRRTFQGARERRDREAGIAWIADEEDGEGCRLPGLDLLEDRPAGRDDGVALARDAEDGQAALEDLGVVDDGTRDGDPRDRIVSQVRALDLELRVGAADGLRVADHGLGLRRPAGGDDLVVHPEQLLPRLEERDVGERLLEARLRVRVPPVAPPV